MKPTQYPAAILAVILASALGACVQTTATPPAPATQPASADCASVAGEWAGSKEGAGYQGALTIPIRPDCTYDWVGTSGVVTPGRLSRSGDQFTYANAAGSRGTVTFSGRSATWVNTFTGGNYTVRVARR